MLIQELMDSKVQYDVIKDNASIFKTRAKIGDRFIEFSATELGADGNGGVEWDVAFYETKDRNSRLTFARTGSGDELKVFSMVIASFKEFMDRYHPTAISFSADKDGESDTRAKLYARMASKYLKGWKADKIEQGSSNTTQFRYTKEE